MSRKRTTAKESRRPEAPDPLELFHAPVQAWFRGAFSAPTRAQSLGWGPILRGASTLLLAPTGSGKTLAAFLAAIDRMMFSLVPPAPRRLRVLYVSPLKALAVDVERNLRSPLAGIASDAEKAGVPFHLPVVAIRSGDTLQADRARMSRSPPDILITTPESLFLLLTASARSILASVETVIVDEIHSVAGTKRGAHFALSLERLERLRGEGASPLQRIGLSATQRPLAEVARFLGGGSLDQVGNWQPRPVEVIDAGTRKQINVTVEVPVENMARLGEPEGIRSGPAAQAPPVRSIWPAIHPRLVELIRAHRSTIIFVNNRRLAERLAASINEEAGEELALSHHGSVAREKREEIEDRLKRGLLPAMVATSSLELGIDMGAVDLVVQIEAPPSVASGLQGIGRANHSVGAVPRGVILPKHRGDLLACAALTRLMREGKVEETRYPRNPLDVLAQQIVAIACEGSIDVDRLHELLRRAAPFADLPRSAFDGVLDMLSGRYPTDEFRELRPRITWDRTGGKIRAREGAHRIVAANAGTIPDRGLYGVFLAGEEGGKSRRVGELDEEMVFETHAGEVFLLGASSWRVEEITHDRVIVSPAPGEPGKMPFWRGDRVGRSLEFGRAVGSLARELTGSQRSEAVKRLASEHGLDGRASKNLLNYLGDQSEATQDVPSDRTVVIERYLDQVGDWRICVLTPFGSRVHAPWATAVAGRLEESTGLSIETLWSDDGMVFRVPETGEPPDPALLIPEPDTVEDLIVRRLGGTSLFAGRFRENAARALLLPRRAPGRRNPLWAQRKRAADLLSVASRYASFPIVLETYRECLRDVFDLSGLKDVLGQIASRSIRVTTVDTRTPSPFASSLLFSYVAAFVYEGDAPLAERRAQALTIDHAQLRELLGDAELRDILDPAAVESVEGSLQRLEPDRRVRGADALHDLFLAVGDLTAREVAARSEPTSAGALWLRELARDRRILRAQIASEARFLAAEDAARYRDALGIALPRGLAAAFLEPVQEPLLDLVSRYSRTHGPFTAEDVARRFGLAVTAVEGQLERLEATGKALSGVFLGRGKKREWCDAEALRAIKRKSLARLRREVEPVAPEAYARLLLDWQGVTRPRAGLEGLLAVIEQLQGCPLTASTLESSILPARVADYSPSMLDELCASGEVLWRGVEPVGQSDGRLAFYRRDRFALLALTPKPAEGELVDSIRRILQSRGAIFFETLAKETGAFQADLLEALWSLVWSGEATNDTFAPVRSMLRAATGRSRESSRRPHARLHRLGPPGSEGRWSLLPSAAQGIPGPSSTERRASLAHALLERYGVLARELVHAEGIEGGYSAVYEVFKAMEESGKARRGYFVAGLGATQFAARGADDRLRTLREPTDDPRAVTLSAVDPANPHGTAIPWPERAGTRPERRAGAFVVLVDGALAAYIGRGERNLLTFLADTEPRRTRTAKAVAQALADRVDQGDRQAFLISTIDGGDPEKSPLAPHLREVGFQPGSAGLLKSAQDDPHDRWSRRLRGRGGDA